MDQIQLQLELAAFEEKISLAELEESKAAERVSELKYERARFQMEACRIACVQMQKEAEERAKAEKNN